MEKSSDYPDKPVKAPVIVSVRSKLILRDCPRMIGDSLSPDNVIDPPAQISCNKEGKDVIFQLDSFKKIETMNKAVIDILNAARLAESVLDVTDNEKQVK
ncbi:MAG: hypothetical protein ACTSP4_03795 [Candidatus Hodarchaeales archaeon]